MLGRSWGMHGLSGDKMRSDGKGGECCNESEEWVWWVIKREWWMIVSASVSDELWQGWWVILSACVHVIYGRRIEFRKRGYGLRQGLWKLGSRKKRSGNRSEGYDPHNRKICGNIWMLMKLCCFPAMCIMIVNYY